MFISQRQGRMAPTADNLNTSNGKAANMTESSCSVPITASRQVLLEKLKSMNAKGAVSWDVEDLDDFFAEKARHELRESPEVMEEAFKRIRELVAAEKDLVVPDDNEFYQKFLRPCKWYPESAFALMKRFYRFRLDHPKVVENLLPSNDRNTFASGIILPLPVRTKRGERVLCLEVGAKWNPKAVSLDQMLRAVMLTLDAAMAEPKTQVAGVHVVINMDGLSVSQVTYFTPSYAAKASHWVQRCAPARLKGIHIINQPFIFNMVFTLFKPFLLEKVRKRLHFHGRNRDKLFEIVDPSAVPTIYGGQFEISDESLGEKVGELMCEFEGEFKIANTYGYIRNS